MNYPTREYQTYADCDQDYVRRTLPSDLVPFWNVDNISQASSYWESENEDALQSARADSGSFNETRLTVGISFKPFTKDNSKFRKLVYF